MPRLYLWLHYRYGVVTDIRTQIASIRLSTKNYRTIPVWHGLRSNSVHSSFITHFTWVGQQPKDLQGFNAEILTLWGFYSLMTSCCCSSSTKRFDLNVSTHIRHLSWEWYIPPSYLRKCVSWESNVKRKVNREGSFFVTLCSLFRHRRMNKFQSLYTNFQIRNSHE